MEVPENGSGQQTEQQTLITHRYQRKERARNTSRSGTRLLEAGQDRGTPKGRERTLKKDTEDGHAQHKEENKNDEDELNRDK